MKLEDLIYRGDVISIGNALLNQTKMSPEDLLKCLILIKENPSLVKINQLFSLCKEPVSYFRHNGDFVFEVISDPLFPDREKPFWIKILNEIGYKERL